MKNSTVGQGVGRSVPVLGWSKDLVIVHVRTVEGLSVSYRGELGVLSDPTSCSSVVQDPRTRP